jgi:hypothetical protein
MSGPVPHADNANYIPMMTDADRADDEADHLFITLYLHLLEQKLIPAGPLDGQDHFSDLMRKKTFPSRSWPPSDNPSPAQLEAITLEWSA